MAAIAASTFREKELSLKAGLNEYVFRDTKPNHIYINNLGGGTIYLSASSTPSAEVYDKKIGSFSEGIYTRETGVTRVLIFNDGIDSNKIKLISFEAAFNPAAMAASIIGAAATGGGGTASEVTVKAHAVPLPAGDNNIGRVKVTEMPAQTFVMDTLPAGVNNIGKVDVNTLPPLAEGNSHIGEVDIRNAITIEAMPPVVISDEPVRAKHHVFEGNVQTTVTTFDMTDNGTLTENVNYISFIENEGTTDLFVSFDADLPAAATANGKNKQIRIKAGEILADLPRKCSKIHFVRASGAGNVRFMGV